MKVKIYLKFPPWEKVIAPLKLNRWLGHLWLQWLQLNVCHHLGRLFYIGVEEFWSTLVFFQISHIERFSSMKCLLKVLPQHLQQIKVRTLTRPLQNYYLISFEPFGGESACALWIIVPLHNPTVLELQDFLIANRIPGKSSRSWSSKVPPDHHTTTSVWLSWSRKVQFISRGTWIYVLHFIVINWKVVEIFQSKWDFKHA